MYSKVLYATLSIVALAKAQTPTVSAVIPPIPSTTDGIPTIEGALIYDGPPVIGYTGPGGNATVQSNNTAATYMAVLPAISFDNAAGTNIMGSIIGTAMSNGTGVTFSVNFTNLPDPMMYGPLVYHIHEFAVPADGNCTGTVGHLDPTDRGELHACEAQAPQTCQAGDLSGKHGNITATTWTVTYSDLYLSTTPGSPYFFGDKSIVIHSSNATRLTCANFTMTSTGTASSTSCPSPLPSVFMGGAGYTASNVIVLAGAAAFLATLSL